MIIAFVHIIIQHVTDLLARPFDHACELVNFVKRSQGHRGGSSMRLIDPSLFIIRRCRANEIFAFLRVKLIIEELSKKEAYRFMMNIKLLSNSRRYGKKKKKRNL